MARVLLSATAALFAIVFGIAPARAQNAYIANQTDGTVSVIDTATNTVIAGPLAVGHQPTGVAVTPDGSKVYVTNFQDNTVAVISTASNTVIAGPITVGFDPTGVAVTPDGSTVYVASHFSGTVSLISTATNMVPAGSITVGTNPEGVAVTPDGTKVYVVNNNNNGAGSVSVINTATNAVGAPIPVGSAPLGVAVTPDSSTVYVANEGSDTVSVIATATGTVTNTVNVGALPSGVAISPDGTKVYVTNQGGGVSVIATGSNTLIGNLIPDSLDPVGVAISPDGSQVYVVNNSGSVSVINTANNTVSAPIAVGNGPISLGNFIVPAQTLTVNVGGLGFGTVTSSPPGINCGPATNECSARFAGGTQVILTASGAAPDVFSGWSGSGCSGTGTCTVSMSQAQSVSAEFDPGTFDIGVTRGGNGTGQVTSTPAGINCSATSNQCLAPFGALSTVTLTASASSGSSFTGWSGGGCSGTGTCQIELTADTDVTATFTQIPSFMLSIAKTGNGTGTVKSVSSGINCGSTCNASFQSGTQVMLLAGADSNSTFDGWSGCPSVNVNGIDCNVTLTANTTVTANFVANASTNIPLFAAVLPTSRSVGVGNPATVFASVINADSAANALACTIAPATSIPAKFVFQTTDPTTNALTGTANTPIDIAPGGVQSLVIALTPTAAFNPTDVAFTFACANAAAAPIATGVDTLNLSASTTPVPDIVALGASADPGYLDVKNGTETGVFAVATFNLGADGTITAAANTGMANLPASLTICQTTAESLCMATPSASVTLDIPNGDMPTFGIFATGNGPPIPNLPGVNRVFVTFTDSNGVLRGETSVAIRTQ